jgi:uncharacterized membrane protein
MKKNRELRKLARSQLHGSWLAAVGFVLVYCIIIGVSGAVVVGPLVLSGPLTIGFSGYFLKKARGKNAELGDLFDGFKVFVTGFLVYLLKGIFTALWTLLFIIPGIVKSLSYSMSFFILRDNPKLSATEAITSSRKMMKGYKWKLFCLYFSFIGWGILCILSFGIGFLWLIPYVSLTLANFYEGVKQNQK